MLEPISPLPQNNVYPWANMEVMALRSREILGRPGSYPSAPPPDPPSDPPAALGVTMEQSRRLSVGVGPLPTKPGSRARQPAFFCIMLGLAAALSVGLSAASVVLCVNTLNSLANIGTMVSAVTSQTGRASTSLLVYEQVAGAALADERTATLQDTLPVDSDDDIYVKSAYIETDQSSSDIASLSAEVTALAEMCTQVCVTEYVCTVVSNGALKRRQCTKVGKKCTFRCQPSAGSSYLFDNRFNYGFAFTTDTLPWFPFDSGR